MKRVAWGLAGLFGLFLLLAFPSMTSATINGGCHAQGDSTSGGTVDLTTLDEWHLKSTDLVSASGSAPTTMTSASVSAYALGMSIPIASGSGTGGTKGEIDSLDISTFGMLGARFTVQGSASGPGGSCSGTITIVLDDVNPLMTVTGGGGIAAVLGAAIAIVLGAVFGGGLLSRVLGGLFGALGGLGLGLSLEQFGLLDPTSPIGLIVLLVCVVVGLIVPGILHSQAAAPSPGFYQPQP
jgi:hypothetical protein